jgi:hypothetical protein
MTGRRVPVAALALAAGLAAGPPPISGQQPAPPPAAGGPPIAGPGVGGPPGVDNVYSNSVRYARGQSIQPVFEGWSRNPDGTIAMWFGYLNRNYEERLNIPVGPDNGFDGEDMGQGEIFEPRRSRFAFKVDVPGNFPVDRDLVWTVKANGVTLKAYGSVWPVWELDQNTISANRGSRTAIDFDEPPNAAPRVVNPPPPQTAETGTPLTLTLHVEDDGNPQPRADRGARVAGITRRAERPLNESLRVSWVQWRGPGVATFDPKVARVVDGKATTTVTFDRPGAYVLRGYAEDASIHTPHDVRVRVNAAAPSPQ